MTRVRRGVILPVVLMVIVLLALLGAAFSFRIHADSASTQAVSNRLQTRLAAEAGVEWVKLLLRTSRLERSVWYRNPAAFNRILLWAYDNDSEVAGTNQKLDGEMAFRFSIVADDWTDDETYTRFGIVDEASKVNLNVATEEQLLKLVRAAVAGQKGANAELIVDAILDWRDTDSIPRNETGGTEGAYYKNLARPYRVKNGPFDTVEELLLVKGVTANVLYGEDFDRNGLLTPNEDDGGQTFPPDDKNGLLNRGLYPYLTVLSYESVVANNNRARLSLLGDENALRAALTEALPDEPSVVEFCVAATRSQPGGTAGQNQSGRNRSGGQPTGNNSTGGDPQNNPGGANSSEGSAPPPANNSGNIAPGGGTSLLPRGYDSPFNADTGLDLLEGKLAAQAQRRPDTPAQEPEKPEDQEPTGSDESPMNDEQTSPDTDTQNPQEGDSQSQETGDETKEDGGDEEAQSSDATNPSSPIRSPAYLLFPRQINGAVQESPVSPEDLSVLLDLTTVQPAETREVVGLINVNTAPRLVLTCIEGLTSDQVDGILSARDSLDDETLATTAWLVSEGIIDNETFARIEPGITARAQQFRIQSLGYADHLGTITRLEVIVDMNGPIAETIYYRDISYLGAPFPIREDDREEQNAR